MYDEEANVLSKKNFKKGCKDNNIGRRVIIMEQKANTFNNPKSIIKGKDSKESNVKDHSNGWDLPFRLSNFGMDFRLNIPILYRH